MQSTVIDQDFAVAPQITAADIAQMAEDGVKTLINNRPDGEEPGQLSAAEAAAEAKRHGITYIHIPMTAATATLADIEATERALQSAPKPILAHCRSGTRCYLMWAATQARAGKDPAQLVLRAAGDGFDIRVLPDLLKRLGR